MVGTSERTALTYPFSEPHGLELDPHYARLRDTEPVSRVRLPSGLEAWLVTRHEHVRTIRSDPRFSSVPPVGGCPVRSGPGMLPLIDAPEHTRLRGLVTSAFTSRRVRDLRPRVRESARRLADRLVATGPPADLMRDFTVPLGLETMGEVLGVPADDHDRLARWSEAFFATTGMAPDEISRRRCELNRYLDALLERRRREPTDDLLGELAGVGPDAASRAELVGLAELLLVAGHESTATMLATMVHVLLGRTRDADRLRADPSRVPRAVEELLRHVPLVAGVFFARQAVADVELGDVTVRAGDAVVMSLPSANHDGRVFDEPDRLDLDRRTNPHMAFGHGPHHCLGAGLARMELHEGLQALLTRLPTVRQAAPDHELQWRTGSLVRGLRALPVAW